MWIFSINACIGFNLWLGICGCEGISILIDLCHFIQGELNICGFQYLWRGPRTNTPQILWDNLSFGRGKSYMQIFNCTWWGRLEPLLPAMFRGQLFRCQLYMEDMILCLGKLYSNIHYGTRFTKMYSK